MTQLLPVIGLVVIIGALLLYYRPTWVPLLFGLAAPFGLVALPGGLQFVTAMSFLLVATAVVDRLQRGLLPLPRNLPALMAVVWSLGIILAMVQSPTLFTSAKFGLWQITAALVALSWAELAGRPRALQRALVAWLIGAIAVALTGFLFAKGGLEASFDGAVVTGRPTGVFGQPNEYGLYCMLVFVFTVGLWGLTAGRLRWLLAATAAISGLGMVQSLSRGAWLGAVAGLLVLFLLVPQLRKPFLVAAWIVVVLGAALTISPVQIPGVTLVTERVLSIADRGSNPYDLRESYRAEGVREWLAEPWLGQGPNTFPELSTQINSEARPGGAEHPHNFFIAVAAEQGIVGIVAVVGFGVAVILAARMGRRQVWAAYRAQRGPPSAQSGAARVLPPLSAALTMAAAAALAALMVEGFADYPMRNALSRTTVWLMVGWALAGQRVLTMQLRRQRAGSEDAAEAQPLDARSA